jgi:hypothetical protein
MKNVKEENVKYTEKENRSMLTEEKKEKKLGDISQSLQLWRINKPIYLNSRNMVINILLYIKICQESRC